MTLSPSRRQRGIEYRERKATEARLATEAAFAAFLAGKAREAEACLEANRLETVAHLERKSRLSAIQAKKRIAHQIFAVEHYTRKDGTLVREHIRRGLPVIHSTYGSGFVRWEQLLDETTQMVNFYPTTSVGKKIGKLFPVGKCALAVDRSHRNFFRYAKEIALAVETVEGLRLTWTR